MSMFMGLPGICNYWEMKLPYFSPQGSESSELGATDFWFES